MPKICWKTELAVFAVVFCIAAPLFTGQTYFWNDAFNLNLPWGAAIKAAIGKGEPLWWSPDIFAGYNSLGGGQSGWNYPPYRLLYWLLPVATAYSIAHIFHYWLLARGVLGFCQEFGLSLPASLVASSTALMGGAVAGHTIHGNIIAGMGWTGILLWLTVRLLRREFWVRDALLLSAALGLMVTVTHPQYVFMALLAMVFMAPWLRASSVGAFCASKRILFALGLGVSLSLVQLLPVMQHAKLNERIRVTKEERAMSRFEYVTQESLDKNSLVRFIQPDFFGSPVRKNWNSDDWRYWETKSLSSAPLILLAIASAISTLLLWRQKSTHFAKAGLALTVLAIFLMLGHQNPAWRILAEVPPFSLFRIPMRFTWLLQLGIALLAAISVMQVEKERPQTIVRWLTAAVAIGPVIILLATIIKPEFSAALKAQALLALVATACILAALFNRHDNFRCTLLKVGLVFAIIDLTMSWYGFVETKPNSEIMAPPPFVQMMQKAPDARLFTINVDSNVGDEESLRYLHVNSGILWGLNYFNGYDTLIPHAQQTIIEKLNQSFLQSAQKNSALEFKRLCDNYSIRWVLAPLSTPLVKGFKEAGRTGPYRLLENPDARPAAYVLPLSQLVIRNEPSAAASTSQAIRPVVVEHQGIVKWRLRTELSEPGLVVLTQSYYPGWHVTVDNRETDMGQFDNLFMAVNVPAGNHVVEFRFDNQWVWAGLRLSQIAALIWVCLFCWTFRRVSIDNKHLRPNL